MGIRIHRVLGYGLTDVETDGKWWPSDSRLNPAYRDVDLLFDRSDAFIEWAKGASKEDLQALADDNLNASLCYFSIQEGRLISSRFLCTYDPEYGESNVLVLSPLTCPDWARWDDMIDYYDHNLRYQNTPTNTVEGVEGGFYPYNGMKCLIPGRENLVLSEGFSELVQGAAKGKMPAMDYKWLTSHAEQQGRARLSEHLKNDWNARIPEDILIFARWMELFTDPTEVYNLKPILYTWWG